MLLKLMILNFENLNQHFGIQMLTRIRIKWKIVSTRDKPSDYYRFMSFSSCQYHMVAPKTSLDEIQIDKCNDNNPNDNNDMS